MSGNVLERGRDAYARGAWLEAQESLSAADRAGILDGDGLELLANSAYMLGRVDDYLGCLQRAYRAHLDAGSPLAALRCAFWIGVNLAQRGEMGRAGGWLGRARRLLEREGGDRVEPATCCCRWSFSRRGLVTWKRPPRLLLRRRRPASGSATPTCSPWPRTSRATS